MVGFVEAGPVAEPALVAVGDLPEPGQARPQLEIAFAVIQAALADHHRTRTDEAHVARKDVPELRQLVERRLPYDAAGAGDAGIVLQLLGALPFLPRHGIGGQMRLEALLGVDDHGAQLPDTEQVPVPADPALAVERIVAVTRDEQCRDQDDRHPERCGGEHEGHVHEALQKAAVEASRAGPGVRHGTRCAADGVIKIVEISRMSRHVASPTRINSGIYSNFLRHQDQKTIRQLSLSGRRATSSAASRR